MALRPLPTPQPLSWVSAVPSPPRPPPLAGASLPSFNHQQGRWAGAEVGLWQCENAEERRGETGWGRERGSGRTEGWGPCEGRGQGRRDAPQEGDGCGEGESAGHLGERDELFCPPGRGQNTSGIRTGALGHNLGEGAGVRGLRSWSGWSGCGYIMFLILLSQESGQGAGREGEVGEPV